MLTIFGMFTILENEVQNDYGVYEKIQRYNSKSPDTLFVYERNVNYISLLQAKEMPLTKQRIWGRHFC